MKKLLSFAICILLGVNTTIAFSQEKPLKLEEAEIFALEKDPMLRSFAEQRRSLEEIAIAEKQYPDPRLKIGTANVPLSNLSFRQEPMTQMQLGVSQMFPRGDTLRLRGDRAKARANIEEQKREARLLTTLLEVRTAWVTGVYWQNVIIILQNQQSALEELVGITEAHYAEGRGQQQDVLRVGLELGLLKDKIIDAQQKLENVRAILNKWIGPEQAKRPFAEASSVFSSPLIFKEIKASISNHPIIGISDAELKTLGSEIDLAEQAYKPEWGIDVNYGMRADDPLGRNRADFVSVMVNLDIPLFTNKRQDRRLSAAKHKEAASRFDREEQILKLSMLLDDAWSDWERSGERLALYSGEISKTSSETYKVTLNAYQNEVSDFSLLIRARLLDFETKLKVLSLIAENKKANARLLYLQGEKDEY
jgi:outer membrane protein TolC